MKADVAYGKAVERDRNSPDGLRLTAQGLRDRARNMADAGDRATMLRLATEYERQAAELELQKARATR
ncbi:MAG TPA: hypothetical protein VJR47_10040 [Stellaceae bacterium]|nr:hypothetical protein [Stellaceae bacterium]